MFLFIWDVFFSTYAKNIIYKQKPTGFTYGDNKNIILKKVYDDDEEATTQHSAHSSANILRTKVNGTNSDFFCAYTQSTHREFTSLI